MKIDDLFIIGFGAIGIVLFFVLFLQMGNNLAKEFKRVCRNED